MRCPPNSGLIFRIVSINLNYLWRTQQLSTKLDFAAAKKQEGVKSIQNINVFLENKEQASIKIKSDYKQDK